MPCGGCGKRTIRAVRSNLSMADDLVRLEYTGINRGPIPFRAVSGTVYRGSSVTYRFVDALAEDVDSLVGTGKFQVVERKTVSKASEIPEGDENMPDEAKTSENQSEGLADTFVVDLSTVESVKNSLNEFVELSELKSALETERDKEKPRSTVIGLLKHAIENHPDYPVNL